MLPEGSQEQPTAAVGSVALMLLEAHQLGKNVRTWPQVEERATGGVNVCPSSPPSVYSSTHPPTYHLSSCHLGGFPQWPWEGMCEDVRRMRK